MTMPLAAPVRAILGRIWRNGAEMVRIVDRSHLGLMAAGVAFFGFLAVFPAAAAAIAILGFIWDPSVIQTQFGLIDDFLPPEAYKLLEGQLQALVSANSSTLGWTTAISLLFALFSARAGIGALIQGLNAVHGHPQRNTVEHTLQAVVMTLFMILIAMTVVVAGFVVPVLLNILPLGEASARTLTIANEIVGLAAVTLGTSLIYRYGPNHIGPRPPLLTPGLVLAVLLWIAASRGLMVYLANFGNYNQIYGSIGAVVALLLWFYLGAYAVLLGAALDSARADRAQ
jgi:membrane protein